MDKIEQIKDQLEWGKENLDSPQDNLSLEDVKYLLEQVEKAEQYKRMLEKIVAFTKYDGNQWYSDAKKLLNK